MRSSIRTAVAALTLVLGVSGTAAAQALAKHPRVQEATALLEQWLDAEQAFKRLPGLSAAVIVDQDVLWQGAYGFADVARKVRATPTTLYSICSISKLFTSVALMQLYEQGKVRLDDPVEKHLPWFQLKSDIHDQADVTVEGILTHAAGLPREAAYPYWSTPFQFPTREQIQKAVSSQEMLYRPETFWQYSNLGLTLVGEIVIAASGQTFDQYVRTNILTPLGLNDTYTDMPAAERGKRLAVGYGGYPRSGERAILPFYQANGIAPAAGFASTVLDLGKFASWQFRLLDKGGSEVLQANTLRNMQRVHFQDPESQTTWGLGFSVSRTDNKVFVGHGGSCPGYRTQLTMRPTEKIAVATGINAIDGPATPLAQRAYALMAPAILAAQKDTAGKIQAADRSLDPYIGVYQSSFGGEVSVIRWEGGLASIFLPNDNPARAITKYRKVGEHTFKRIRDDGELAEATTFDLDANGKVLRMRSNYNVMPRIR